ncbi:MAG: CoA transferase [Acidimicrobiia bacterium]|nr:CoA transferase [Acidimicrobiia bacterium]MDH4362889.1 CoA transferase [Acidimicrobiia bacterium]MDH5289202.1 CoA transferase [Acidimicrobiia bacterium]
MSAEGCRWPARAVEVLAQLPVGAAEAATASLRRGLGAAGRLDDHTGWLAPDAVAAQLVLPLLTIDTWPGPSQPLAVGDGAVHADLIDEDHDRLAILRSILADVGPVNAEILAAEAQDWRLPVTPYRDLPPAPPRPPAWAAASPVGWERAPLVIDLTALWAGPLATSLLADLGARVVKIDPGVRPDGFREHPPLYGRLNGAKEIVDLDLRRDDHRHRFEALVDEADLVIDSFSRRVMPNFGYGPDDLRRRNPRVATLSIVAFPAGTREASWVSYGPGVHAWCGLGTRSEASGRHVQPAPVAYPDALAGLEAFAVAAGLLAAGARVGAGPGRDGLPHREVSLAGALAPVVARAIADRTGARAGDG